MRNRLSVAVLISASALLAACGGQSAAPPAAAPAQAGGVPSAIQVQAPPVHSLLGYRGRLELTSEQIEVIDSIGIWLQEANRPHSTELRRVMAAGGSRIPGRGSPRLNEEALPLIETIAENNRAAVEGVRETLTEEQRAEVCQIYATSTRAGAGAAGAGQRGSAQRPPPRAGAQGEMRGFGRLSPWGWCAPQPEGEAQRTANTPDAR